MVPAGMHNRDSKTKFQQWLAQYVNEACWSNHPHDIVLIGARGLKSSGRADSCVVGHLLFLFQGTLCALRPEIVGRRAQANMMRSATQRKAAPVTSFIGATRASGHCCTLSLSCAFNIELRVREIKRNSGVHQTG